MTKQQVKNLLENYECLQMRSALYSQDGSVCSESVQKEAALFQALNLILKQLPEQERTLIEKVFIAKQTVVRCARERGYSRRNIYYLLDRIIEKLAAGLTV